MANFGTFLWRLPGSSPVAGVSTIMRKRWLTAIPGPSGSIPVLSFRELWTYEGNSKFIFSRFRFLLA